MQRLSSILIQVCLENFSSTILLCQKCQMRISRQVWIVTFQPIISFHDSFPCSPDVPSPSFTTLNYKVHFLSSWMPWAWLCSSSISPNVFVLDTAAHQAQAFVMFSMSYHFFALPIEIAVLVVYPIFCLKIADVCVLNSFQNISIFHVCI